MSSDGSKIPKVVGKSFLFEGHFWKNSMDDIAIED